MRKGTRTIGLAIICSLITLLHACSDNTSQKTPPPPKAASQSSPTQSAVSQAPPQAAKTPAPAQAAPAADGGKCSPLLTGACTACHNTTRICEKLGKKSKSRWQRTVDRMIERGAKLTAEEETTLLDCLDNGLNVLQDACR